MSDGVAWQCGIDEAGYGPNLGPFVATLAAIPLPAALANVDLWSKLAPAVRKAGGPRDDRILVDDSKAIHAAGQGLARLERNLLPFLAPPLDLPSLWERCCLTPPEELQAEPWHLEDPSPAETASPHPAAARLAASCLEFGIGPVCFTAVVVFPRLFNALAEGQDSKGAVPLWTAGQLLERLPAGGGRVALDKLGARNRYADWLGECFFGRPVACLEEGESLSRYRLAAADGAWECRIEPKADQNHFAVALASMFSKWLRERLMARFNDWWRQQLPGLAPTAGYPVDARRWWEQTESLRRQLGVADELLWRKR